MRKGEEREGRGGNVLWLQLGEGVWGKVNEGDGRYGKGRQSEGRRWRVREYRVR